METQEPRPIRWCLKSAWSSRHSLIGSTQALSYKFNQVDRGLSESKAPWFIVINLNHPASAKHFYVSYLLALKFHMDILFKLSRTECILDKMHLSKEITHNN